MNKIIIFLLFSLNAQSKTMCEYLKLENCNNSTKGLDRSNSASFPNSSSAAFNNPTAISMERGFGLESITYQKISRLGIVSGTGRVGAAISNAPTGETFFSNLALESVNNHRGRHVNTEVYAPDNFSFAFAFNLFGKKKKKGFSMDVGAIYKHHGETKRDFSGLGATLSFNKMISIGYSKYSDVFYEDLREQTVEIYDQEGNTSTVETSDDEDTWLTDLNVNVENIIIGIKWGNFAIDHLTIITTYEDDDIDPIFIKILTASVFYKKWIFTFGNREEDSHRENYKDEVFEDEEKVYDRFVGAQYSIGKYFLVGIFQNYYLLNEISLGVTFFI